MGQESTLGPIVTLTGPNIPDSSVRAGLDQSKLVGGDRRLNTVSDLEFAQQRGDVCLDRALAQIERRSNLRVGLSPGEFKQHLCFARCEPGQQ